LLGHSNPGRAEVGDCVGKNAPEYWAAGRVPVRMQDRITEATMGVTDLGVTACQACRKR